MRSITFLLILFFSLSGVDVRAQEDEVYSVFFRSSAVMNKATNNMIPEQYFGKYALKPTRDNDLRADAGNDLVVDETGIYIEKNMLISISREEIRENPKYTLRDGYLHGVVEGDSVMVALDGENYFFLIPKKIFLYDNGGTIKLIKDAKRAQYLLFSKEENGHYSALGIEFTSSGKVELKELRFGEGKPEPTEYGHTKILENEMNTYLLNLKNGDLKNLFDSLDRYDTYLKIDA